MMVLILRPQSTVASSLESATSMPFHSSIILWPIPGIIRLGNMMAFQFTPPGVLNRLRASVVYNDFPQLNVTSNFLTTEGIRLALEGNATDLLPAMVSLVSSPAPYLAASITMSIVRSSTLAEIYKLQFEDTTLVGLVSIFPDTDVLNPFIINN